MKDLIELSKYQRYYNLEIYDYIMQYKVIDKKGFSKEIEKKDSLISIK